MTITLLSFMKFSETSFGYWYAVFWLMPFHIVELEAVHLGVQVPRWEREFHTCSNPRRSSPRVFSLGQILQLMFLYYLILTISQGLSTSFIMLKSSPYFKLGILDRHAARNILLHCLNFRLHWLDRLMAIKTTSVVRPRTSFILEVFIVKNNHR